MTTLGTNKVTGTAFINLESSSKSVIFYWPDTGNATVIDSYSSPSYAPHFKRPYTVDDQLFVSNKFTNGGAMTITEYDTDKFNRKSDWGTHNDAQTQATRWPVVRCISRPAALNSGQCPGDYMRSPFNSQSDSTEMTKPELGFALISGGDTLYGAKLPTEADPITEVFVVDLNTGQRADEYLTAFEVEDWDTYDASSWSNVVISDGMAYWAGFVDGPSGYKIEILAASLSDPESSQSMSLICHPRRSKSPDSTQPSMRTVAIF